MRSTTAMNSSGLSTLPCLSPILTSDSSDAPSHTTTLAVVFSYVPSTILTSASGTPTHSSVAITISLGTVSKAFSKSTNHRAILQALLHHLRQDVHPVCLSADILLLSCPCICFSGVLCAHHLLLVIAMMSISQCTTTPQNVRPMLYSQHFSLSCFWHGCDLSESACSLVVLFSYNFPALLQ